MAYKKLIHLVWLGTGTPKAHDLHFLEAWSKLIESPYKWHVTLWSDGKPIVGSPSRVVRRTWLPKAITQESFETGEFTGAMNQAVGTSVWSDLVRIIDDEKTPTPDDPTTKYVIKLALDPGTTTIRNLMYGANYAAASDIIRAAVMYLKGGFYTDMASYPGPYNSEMSLGKRVTPSLDCLNEFNNIANDKSGITVLWNQDARLVNNAFLGASAPGSDFWAYFLKAVHKMYNELIYEPDLKSLQVFFTHYVRNSKRYTLNEVKLKKRIKTAGGMKEFMRSNKRLALRALTLYTSGPYLLRCCLHYFYAKRSGFITKRWKASIPTVKNLTAFVEEMEGDGTKNQPTLNSEAAKAAVLAYSEPQPVNYERQNQRVQKIQRGSWDQSPVPGFFIDIYDEQ